MTVSAPRLRVHQLAKSFGRLQAVNGVSFEIAPGEILGLIGPIGAGKSTTVRIITGQLLADSGQVEVDGDRIDARPIEARRRTGYVPQRLDLYPFLTGREVLKFVADTHEVSDGNSRIDGLLERFGLADAQHRLTREYSEGMARKLAVAAALVGDPAVLVLDESLAGLDPRAGAEVKAVIRERLEAGSGVLMVSHSLEVLERLSHRVVILDGGQVQTTLDAEHMNALRQSTETLEDRFLAHTGPERSPR